MSWWNSLGFPPIFEAKDDNSWGASHLEHGLRNSQLDYNWRLPIIFMGLYNRQYGIIDGIVWLIIDGIVYGIIPAICGIMWLIDYTTQPWLVSTRARTMEVVLVDLSALGAVASARNAAAERPRGAQPGRGALRGSPKGTAGISWWEVGNFLGWCVKNVKPGFFGWPLQLMRKLWTNSGFP